MTKKKNPTVENDSPDVANPEPVITEANLDPALVYSIDTDRNGTRGLGFVVNLTNDPVTKVELIEERRRFFVFAPGATYPMFTMPVDEAVTKNIKREGRVGSEERALFDKFLATA